MATSTYWPSTPWAAVGKLPHQDVLVRLDFIVFNCAQIVTLTVGVIPRLGHQVFSGCCVVTWSAHTLAFLSNVCLSLLQAFDAGVPCLPEGRFLS